MVVSNAWSGAPANGATPWKIARIAFMFLPFNAGLRTELPPTLRLVDST